MYTETATWIGRALAEIDLPEGARIADVGSSTLSYRTVEQPHVDREVFAPLRERGFEIVHSDVKDAVGVDVVFDVSDRAKVATDVIGSDFDLVIAIGLFQVVPDWRWAIRVVSSLARPGGYVLAESPHVYRRVFDPDDNFWRPSPDELTAEFQAASSFEVVSQGSLRIDGEYLYRGLVSRASWTPLAGRWWIPLPGVTERIRYRVPAWRWKDSIVLLRKHA